MNVAAVKEKIKTIKLKRPNIQFSGLESVTKYIKNKYFVQGISAVLVIYLLLLGYVYMSSKATLNAIKDNIPSHTSELVFLDSPIKQKEKKASPHHQKQKKKTTDTNIKDLVIKGLYQKTQYGLLPKIREKDNLTGFRAYQNPFDLNTMPNLPVVTFIVDGYGLSNKLSQTMLDILPAEVSLSLNPNVSMPNEWVKKAHEKGHEVWLHLPIQSNNNIDGGKNTIFHHAALPEKVESLYKTMSTTQGYTGISAFTDEQIQTTESEHYTQLMNKIYERGLGYIELNPNATKLLEGSAINLGAPYIKADTHVLTMKGDKHSFDEIEKLAKKNGHITVVVPPYPKTIKYLAVWIEKVGQTEYAIAPVSAIYDIPFHKSTGKGKASKKLNKQSAPAPLSEHDHIEPDHKSHKTTHKDYH